MQHYKHVFHCKPIISQVLVFSPVLDENLNNLNYGVIKTTTWKT